MQDDSDATAATQFTWVNEIYLRTTLSGETCYLAFDEDGQPVTDPCGIDIEDPDQEEQAYLSISWQ